MRTLLTFTLLCGAITSVWADDVKSTKRTIAVTGTATVELTPDTVVLSLTMKNKNDNAAVVADQHVVAVKRTVETISRLNVLKTDITTSSMQFGENREYRKSEWVREGFLASSELSVTVRDLSQYIPVWKSLASIEGVSVNSIRFEHSKRIEAMTDARKKAIAVAKTKAETLAAVYDAKIGPPISIEEESTSEYFGHVANVQSNRMDVSAPEDATGSGGKKQVKARFRVVFELLP